MKLSELDLAAIVGSAMDAIISVDSERRVVLFNTAAEKLFGYTATEALGQRIDRFIPGLFGEEGQQKAGDFRKARSGPRVLRSPSLLRGRRADGKEFSIEASASQVGVAEEKVCTVFVRDITERARMQARYRRLVDSNVQGVMFWNEKGEITTANDAFLRMIGMKRSDLEAGRLNWRELSPPEYAASDERALQEIAANGICAPIEKELFRRDGSRAPVLVGAASFDDDPSEGVCFVLDRTENQSAERASALLAAIVASSFDAIIGKDLDGVVTSWNNAAEDMFGYSAQEMIGRSMTVLIPPDHLCDEAIILSKIRAGERVEHFETQRRRKDGTLIDISVTVSPIKDSRGQVIGASKLARDISERRRAAEEIRSLNADLERRVAERTAQLQAANSELEAFSYSVSHDLRAPLRSIDGFSQVLLEDSWERLDDEGRDSLRRIRASSQRMAQLIDDLLNLSRVTRVEMRRQTVDLSAVAREEAKELQANAPDRGVRFVIADGLIADGDPALLRIVINNLFSNAWKFTGKRTDANIELGIRQENGEPILFVTDNGAGFDMAYAGRLFGAFQRLHAATEFPGTGIGLATVQRIVRRHGGRIWATSAEGAGATFQFTLR